MTMQLVGTNYQASLLKYIDKENLPEYLGGTSKATLLDDVGPWQTQSVIDEIDADMKAALSPAKDVEANSTKGGILTCSDCTAVQNGLTASGEPHNLYEFRPSSTVANLCCKRKSKHVGN